MKQPQSPYILGRKKEKGGNILSELPNKLVLTKHASQRLKERKQDHYTYNTDNLMDSGCVWYTRDDLIEQSDLYRHSLYVCRKSKDFNYLTDGNIEVVYNEKTNVIITIMEVKEKFLPINKYMLSSNLETKKERKKMRKIGVCPDCGKENVEITNIGICVKCKTRKTNARNRKTKYVPYIKLSKKEQHRIDAMQQRHKERNEAKKKEKEVVVVDDCNSNNINEDNMIRNMQPTLALDEKTFVNTLKECGYDVDDNVIQDVFSVLLATDKLKDICTTITDSDNQDAVLQLEQVLNIAERKLQYDWEIGGFQEADDIKFKNFLSWRRLLKDSIFFWKRLYQTGALMELQRAWNSYTADPTEKITLAENKTKGNKKFQITTESISTILNTRRAFTRVFYANTKEQAYSDFLNWMADRQLHEDKSKTTIVELTD